MPRIFAADIVSFSSCRSVLRRNAIPLSLGMSTGALVVTAQRPMRFDSSQPARSMSNGRKDRLDPGVIRQLSGGSVAGFTLGLVVSLFSRTIVFLAGLGVLGVQLASRYGLDVAGRLNLRNRVSSSRVLSYLARHPAFGVSFGLTFALSAFMSF